MNLYNKGFMSWKQYLLPLGRLNRPDFLPTILLDFPDRPQFDSTGQPDPTTNEID
jgi:hypothetical protein